MKMLDDENFDVQRGGDLMTWYWNNIFDSDLQQLKGPSDSAWEAGTMSEVVDFEREILSDISGQDVEIGLSDYISLMAQPPYIWREKYEFPRLYSWSQPAQDSIFTLFNYMKNASFRGDLKLTEPNFETFSLTTLCTDPDRRSLYEDYCRMTENLPDLELMMHLMHLAEYPLSFNEEIRDLFK